MPSASRPVPCGPSARNRGTAASSKKGPLSASRSLAALVALSSGVAAGTTAAASSPDSPYAFAVERYADGDRSGAGQQLAALDPSQVPAGARGLAGRLRLLSDDGRRNALLKAATLLHTDAALERRAAGDPVATDSQLELALLYVGLVDSVPADADLRTFARRWYLAAALDRQRYLEAEGAGALLRQGLRRFPTDPELRLARGSVEETLGTWPPLRGAPGGRIARSQGTGLPTQEGAGAVLSEAARGRDGKSHLQEAEKEYRAVLAADGALHEARLRHGRVLLLLGKAAEAGAEIDRVLREGRDPALRYLAFLFQGRCREGEGDFARAVEAYRAGAALFPEAQTVHMALGHALDRLGDLRGSRDELRRAVVEGSPLFERPDPWWAYPYGQSSRADSLLAELRDGARR